MLGKCNPEGEGQLRPSIALTHVSKSFPGVVANDNVSINFYPGEIHALLGENGAGKSTLMNILAGINQPDSGSITLDGNEVALRSAAQAIRSGIGMVHQHFRLVKAFTVAENIHLGWADTPWRSTARNLRERTAQISAEYGFHVQPDAYIHQLSAGEQQRVEILRMLARGANILILDEPTAVLTPQESRELFRSLRQLRDRGKTIIFISHKLDEVIEVADRLTVMRRGQVVFSSPNEGMTTTKLASLMVGRDVIFERPLRESKAGGDVLKITDVCARNARGNEALRNVSLSVRAGEILGIGGVAGNGQRELAEVMTGLLQPTSGEIELAGKVVTGAGPSAFSNAGVGHMPEDRLRTGFAGSLPIAHNVVLREYRGSPLASGPWFSLKEAFRLAAKIVDESQVEIPSLHKRLGDLSGGNQQRLMATREGRIAERVLIAVYPTRGLDVGAIERLRGMFMKLRESGVGILLISEDLDELLQVSDRIAILFDGRVSGEACPLSTSREELGLLMGGKSIERRKASA